MVSSVSVSSNFGHMLPAELVSYVSVGRHSPARGLLCGVSGFQHPLLVTSINEQGCVIHFEHENGPELRDIGLGGGFSGPLVAALEFRVDPGTAYVYSERSAAIGALLLGTDKAMHLVTRHKRGMFEDAYEAPLTDKIVVHEKAIGYLSWAAGLVVDGDFVELIRVAASR